MALSEPESAPDGGSDTGSGLNPDQLDAVTHLTGPLLVVAGAGSGKTRVLTRRIAHLIGERDVSPFAILAITFTNKAAGEMKERVAELVGSVANRMWVSTFHSACVRILRRDGDRLGFPSSFSIYDQGDAVRLTGYVVRDQGLDIKRFPARAVHSAISAAKNEGRTAGQYVEHATGPYEKRIGEVFVNYQARLLAAGAMDFDDLLGNAVRLLREHPDVLDHYRQRFEHVLVDEYQDTNVVQNDLVMLLASGHRNVCVVGDSDQSIYRFRGADIRNILEFERSFPDATVVVLDQNYRSTQTILDAANAVITRNGGRKPKELWTDAGSGEPITRFRADDENDEARWVVSQLRRLHDGGRPWTDMAVFYRTNAQSRAVEEQLVMLGVPYKVVGGLRFYDRREVRDAMAYLKLATNPADEVAAKRVLNVPKRGVGNTSVARLDAHAASKDVRFVDALRDSEAAGVLGRAATGIRSFLELVDALAQAVDDGPATILEVALERSGYLEELRADRSIEAEGRLENLSELVGVASEFDDVDEFLERVGLVADTDDLPAQNTEGGDPEGGDLAASDTDPGQVVLMTMHAAKGLEYPVVCIVGMEDGVFPHVRALGDPEELEEERRLAYVGITRARERLMLTHTWSRMLHGQTQYNPPSRFLDEIPSELLVDAEGTRKANRRKDDSWPGSGAGASRSRSADTDWLGAPRRSSNRDAEPSGRVFGGGSSNGGSTRSPGESSSGAHELGLRVGDDVVHRAWGDGVVLAVHGDGDRAEAVVRFASKGEKRLLLAWAPLVRPGDVPEEGSG
ncbi:MAG: UvrD-helicase domain-containing protein [Acidimicrobiales bacterium]|jgi:DNA helicase-2/ATP-dependent DNA helicase PcrA|nr:UvrD-helicase domain-containing protein [Acidimicrobiales bacterium]MDP6286269.1 UvrD-helicase domain-containing protein [Acidimicrobiales bacterium]MDP6911819.1 UvrD-helicase domain-containing protein [Acidimicrobiales bacterium]HJP24835.1 UvrD-helicase domain-containing protein [Acidimicrobiales bacterium]